ncbi:hypothetical protein [Fulvimarina sp. MAC3]|uniref:hypothetical protein n=1 Tax=Fulvimarina sp. MAC3 TaxID=3148887 RepID=UPI0031FD7D8D
MNLGRIVKRAVSAFAGSKRRTTASRPTRTTNTVGRTSRSSGQSDIVRGVTKMAKKKL